MLQNLKQLYDRKLGANDGDLGHVKDFYFDDKSWSIRYLVADTGSWLSGRQVLLSRHAFGPHAFSKLNVAAEVLPVDLSRQQIAASPSIDTHRPVSRQFEEDYYHYYGWPNYWDAGGLGSMPIAPVPPVVPTAAFHHGHQQRDDLHLRSTKATTGYSIHATDGQIGTVTGFMVNTTTWIIGELVVDTGPWYTGKPVLIRTENVSRISFDDSTIFVKLTLDAIRETAKGEVVHP
jgi:uncharacterized protein YrrD